MVDVTFTYQDWIAIYPQFSSVAEPIAENSYAVQAQFLIGGVLNAVTDPKFAQMLLYLATAHVAQLSQNALTAATTAGGSVSGGGGGPQLVGRISSATEGSVSVATELTGGDRAGVPSAYWGQTAYGLELWELTRFMRTFRYRANKRFIPSGGAFGGGWGGWV